MAAAVVVVVVVEGAASTRSPIWSFSTQTGTC